VANDDAVSRNQET